MSGLTDAKAAVRRFWKTRSRYSFLRTPLITRYEGGWLLAYPDEMGYVMFFKRGFENDERRAFQKLLRSGRIHTVIDVGANQGLYALTAARWLPAGRVIAFEPVEGEASKLSRNISLNRYSNITVEHLAVGARVEEASIFIALSGMGAYSSLRPPAEDVTAETVTARVPVTTLDAYVAEKRLPSVDLVKVDVEGGERDVLKGSDQVIDTFRPTFMVEVEDRRSRQWGYRAREIIDLLTDRDYRWYQADRGGELREHIVRESYGWQNLFAVAEEKTKLVSIIAGTGSER